MENPSGFFDTLVDAGMDPGAASAEAAESFGFGDPEGGEDIF
jgi:hypothetical protein